MIETVHHSMRSGSGILQHFSSIVYRDAMGGNDIPISQMHLVAVFWLENYCNLSQLTTV